MDNLWGWLVFIISYLVLWLSLYSINRKPVVFAAGVFVLTAHFIISYINIAHGPLVFAKYDAWGFHLFAEKFADTEDQLQWLIGTPIYKSILLVLYKWMGASLWLGQGVSILFFSISIAAIVRIMRYLSIEDDRLLALGVLLFGLIPSGLMYGSITLREPFMTTCLILGVEFGIRSIQSSKTKDVMSAAGFWMLMGLFHQVMMVYAFFLTVILLIFHLRKNGKQNDWTRYVPGLLLFGVATILFWRLGATGGDNYFAMLISTIPESIALYRQAGESSQPLTVYQGIFSFSTWPEMFFSLLCSYFYYLGWPVGGDYKSIWVWVVIADSLVRLFGLCASLILWRSQKMWLILFVYISLSFMWSIGTTNYGQALRHHMMTDWLMILAGVLLLQYKLSLRNRD